MSKQNKIDQHRQLVIDFSKPGGILSSDAPTATVRNPDWFKRLPDGSYQPSASRRRLHNHLISEYLQDVNNAPAESKAIVLAGPPGAGKSTILNELLKEDPKSYFKIDADDFKELLLRQAQEDGSYDSFILPSEIKSLINAGEQFYPMEMASLVHEESSMLAERLRRELVNSGSNIIVDTVLSSETSALALGDLLSKAGYKVEVIDVEVSYEISKARIAKRWQQSYEAALKDPTSLGGRWVPSEYAKQVFGGPGGISRPEAIAKKLAQECVAVERYRLYRTTAIETESRPAEGSWECDYSRVQGSGPLVATAHARGVALRALSRPTDWWGQGPHGSTERDYQR